VDGAIALAIAIIAGIPFGILDSGNDDISGLWLVVAVPLCTAYFWVTMRRGGARNGQTLGKQALGMRVVRDDGDPIGLWTVLFRELLLRIVGWITVIGWLADGLWPLRDGEHRAIHDLIASTHVVSSRHQIATPSAVVVTPPKALAPEIQRHVTDAGEADARIREAIQRAELPYTEVGREVDSLLAVIGRSAQRAQLLREALHDTPVAKIEGRLRELANTDKHELIDALEQQLEVQRRMQWQLDHFNDEMERIVVELETIRGSLLNVSASTDVENQQRLAEQVRALRDEISSVATGMSAAFD
jgi:uncharacterized RDD family membrane protein YckC